MKTSHPTIEFVSGFPPALAEEITSILTPFLWLARDLKKLYISMKGSSDEAEGESAILPLTRYHVAHIAFDPSFWALGFEDKERVVLHEIFHVVTDDYTRKVAQALDAIPDETLRRHLAAFLLDAEEELVDRLAWDFYDFAFADEPSKARTPRLKRVSASA